MCRPMSAVLTQSRCLWSVDSDSHGKIILDNGLDDSTRKPDFVRVELIPFAANYKLPLHRWVYCVDQDYRPAWYTDANGEAATRREWRKWLKARTIRSGETRDIHSWHRVLSGGIACVYEEGKAHVYNGGTAYSYDGGTAYSYGGGTIRWSGKITKVKYAGA